MKTAGKKLGGLLKKTVSWAIKHPETTSGIVDLSATLIKKRSKKNPQPQENSNLKNIAIQKNCVKITNIRVMNSRVSLRKLPKKTFCTNQVCRLNNFRPHILKALRFLENFAITV